MGLLDTIKQTGSNSIRNLAGSAGRAIDVIGRKSPIQLPELQASEKLEYFGSGAQTVDERVKTRTEQGKPIAGQDTEAARKQGLDFTYDPNIGISGDKPAFNLQEQKTATSKPPEGKFTTGETAALGLDQGQLWNGNTVNINGSEFVVRDNGDGTRSFIPKSSGGGQPSYLSGSDKVKAIQGAGDDILKNLGQSNIDDILGKQFQNTQDLANELERVARENANREYDTVMTALGRQKGEVGTLAKQQKENIQKQGEFAEEDLSTRQEKEKKEIGEQRKGYEEQVEETKDQLGSAWRDMSLEIQRIMRGRGVSDSSFAAGSEIEVLKDFNKGLRKLAVESAGALKDFSDAIVETTQFYERKKVQLAEEVRVSVQKVDDWVRQRTIDIQNREDMALSNKLKEINNAVLRAQELKTNISNEILQKQLDYDLWLKQVEVNYKMSVASAAQGKVQSAADKIKESAAISKAMFTLLDNGQASFVQGENGQYALVDGISGAIIPTRPGFKDEYAEEQDLERQKLFNQANSSSNIFGNFFGNTGATQTQNDEEEGGGGFFSSIMGTS